MNSRLLKGSKGLAETHEFAAVFPVAHRGDPDMILTTGAFDHWAAGVGYYALTCEDATLLTARNNLRKKINATASSEAWTVLGYVPFSIDVHDHGKSYKVRRTEDACTTKADRLPSQVRQFATTKRNKIQQLMTSIDMRNLPAIMQMRIGLLESGVDRFLRGIDHETTELNREYESVRAQLQMLVDKKLVTPENGGLRAILGPDKPDDDEGEPA